MPTRADELSQPRLFRVADLIQPDQPADVDPTEDSEPSKPRTVLKLGTPRDTVESLLGRPATESLIPALRRVMATYTDDTKFIYLDGRLISFTPGSNARELSGGSYLIQRDNATVVLDSAGLQECGTLIADDVYKCLIEKSPHFLEPGALPTAHGDFPYGPAHVYWPPPWPIHAERVMPMRLQGYNRRAQHIYYRPYDGVLRSPYIAPSHR